MALNPLADNLQQVCAFFMRTRTHWCNERMRTVFRGLYPSVHFGLQEGLECLDFSRDPWAAVLHEMYASDCNERQYTVSCVAGVLARCEGIASLYQVVLNLRMPRDDWEPGYRLYREWPVAAGPTRGTVEWCKQATVKELIEYTDEMPVAERDAVWAAAGGRNV